MEPERPYHRSLAATAHHSIMAINLPLKGQFQIFNTPRASVAPLGAAFLGLCHRSDNYCGGRNQVQDENEGTACPVDLNVFCLRMLAGTRGAVLIRIPGPDAHLGLGSLPLRRCMLHPLPVSSPLELARQWRAPLSASISLPVAGTCTSCAGRTMALLHQAPG